MQAIVYGYVQWFIGYALLILTSMGGWRLNSLSVLMTCTG